VPNRPVNFCTVAALILLTNPLTIQTIIENVYVWLVGPWRHVSEH